MSKSCVSWPKARWPSSHSLCTSYPNLTGQTDLAFLQANIHSNTTFLPFISLLSLRNYFEKHDPKHCNARTSLNYFQNICLAVNTSIYFSWSLYATLFSLIHSKTTKHRRQPRLVFMVFEPFMKMLLDNTVGQPKTWRKGHPPSIMVFVWITLVLSMTSHYESVVFTRLVFHQHGKPSSSCSSSQPPRHTSSRSNRPTCTVPAPLINCLVPPTYCPAPLACDPVHFLALLAYYPTVMCTALHNSYRLVTLAYSHMALTHCLIMCHTYCNCTILFLVEPLA